MAVRNRLLLSFGLIILVTLGSVWFFASRTRQEVRNYSFMLRGGMASSPELVAELEGYYAENGSWSGVEELFDLPGMHGGMGQGMGPGMMGIGGQRRIRIANGVGNYVYDSSDGSPSGKLSTTERQTALPLTAPDGSTAGYVLIEGDEAGLLSRLDEIGRSAALVAAGVALVLALVLATSLSRPIHALTVAANRMARGDLSQRVKPRGQDEIATLGQAFNQMAATLEQAEQSRRSMTADIAHELRTPLAVQRAQLEALQDGIYPPTSGNLQALLDQNAQLTRLVDDLRTLALAEAGELSLERTLTDLVALTQRVVERFKPQGDAKEITLTLDTQPTNEIGQNVEVDPGRIEQILTNLLTNALRYTPQGGAIRVSIQDRTREITLQVRDSGPGISEEALPHVFERFYRADRSRNRTDGGTGLGLAIARQLARAHHGDLTAANDPTTGGAVFTLTLPV